MMTPRVKSLLAKKKKANDNSNNIVNNLSVPPFSMVDDNVHTGGLADSCTSLETDDWNVDGIEDLKDGGRRAGTPPTPTSASSKRCPWSSSSSTMSMATSQPPESPMWSTPQSRRKVFSKSRIASLESLSRAVVPQQHQQQQKPNASKRGGLWNIFSSLRDLKVEHDHEDDCDHHCVQLQSPPTPTTCTTPSSSSRRSVGEDMTKLLRQHQRSRRNMLDSSPTPPRTTVTRTTPSSISPLMKRAPSLRHYAQQCDDHAGNHRPNNKNKNKNKNDLKKKKKHERMVRRGSITQYNLDDSIDTLQGELLAFSFRDGRVPQQLQPQQ
jgi:hypothetical protein